MLCSPSFHLRILFPSLTPDKTNLCGALPLCASLWCCRSSRRSVRAGGSGPPQAAPSNAPPRQPRMSAEAQQEGAGVASAGLSGPPATPAPVTASAATEAAAAAPAEPSPSLRWVGEPTLEGEGRRYYAAFDSGSQRFNLGNAVYLWPAEPGTLPFVAHLESLHEQLPGSASGGTAAHMPEAAPRSKWVGVRWFYRPSELDVQGPFKAEEHELFWADEYAVHPLEAVCGKCVVLTPAQADRRPDSTAAHPGDSDVFVCSRKYLPGERRVVPLDDAVEGVTLTTVLQEKSFQMVEGRAVQRAPTAADKAAAHPRPKRVRGASYAGPAAAVETPGGAAAAAAQPEEAAEPQEEEEQPLQDLEEPSTIDPQQPPAKKRRHEQAHSHEHLKGRAGPGSSAAAAAAMAAPSSAKGGGVATRRSARSTEAQPSNVSGGSSQRSEERGSAGGAVGSGASSGRGKTGKEMHGRWARERYEAGQQGLVAALRQLGATSADRAVLRLKLREQARRAVGDTGLLDHLLKHLVDQVVTPDGERLQRRRDLQGHMVYHLCTPAEAARERQALQEEMGALSSELREVKEVRRVLSAARDEAQLQAASVTAAALPGVASPSSAGPTVTVMPAAGSPAPVAAGAVWAAALMAAQAGMPVGVLVPAAPVNAPAAPAVPDSGSMPLGLPQQPEEQQELVERVAAAEGQAQALLSRLQDAESLARTGPEEGRGEASEAARLLGSRLQRSVAQLADVARGVGARCSALEHQVALLAEEGRGRYEALAAAVIANSALREEVGTSRARISRLEVQAAALQVGMAALAAAAADRPALCAVLEAAATAGQGAGAAVPLRSAAAAQGSEPVGGLAAAGLALSAQQQEQQQEQQAGWHLVPGALPPQALLQLAADVLPSSAFPLPAAHAQLSMLPQQLAPQQHAQQQQHEQHQPQQQAPRLADILMQEPRFMSQVAQQLLSGSVSADSSRGATDSIPLVTTNKPPGLPRASAPPAAAGAGSAGGGRRSAAGRRTVGPSGDLQPSKPPS
ncbi:hypothetical protein ABPG75_009453 [Micractinium tetrahymenae]